MKVIFSNGKWGKKYVCTSQDGGNGGARASGLAGNQFRFCLGEFGHNIQLIFVSKYLNPKIGFPNKMFLLVPRTSKTKFKLSCFS